MRPLPYSLALWTCAVAASGTARNTSPEAPLFSEVVSEPLVASASPGRLAACVAACLAQTHVAGVASSDEVGRVRQMFRARLRRMKLAHRKELAQLHFRIGRLVAARKGVPTQRLAQRVPFGIASQMSRFGQAAAAAAKHLAPGWRSTQAIGSAASNPWSARWAHQAGPPDIDHRQQKERATVSGGRKRAPQLGRVASSRVLLQEHDESTDGKCSAEELMAVQTDPIAAVTRLMEANMGCALCLIPCGSAANTLGCAVRCVKQARPSEALWTVLALCLRARIVRALMYSACVRARARVSLNEDG